ncbi:hypothetical protein V5O48_017062 [Marasmius crinis-equi]|uniref:Uncharacterized protein n=1 Tax=Marasmius crinis-equi TaxID=585013 RepID=A0ABR3EQ11_9AGAR
MNDPPNDPQEPPARYFQLRSGRFVLPVFPPVQVPFLDLINNASQQTTFPPITVEEDLGLEPLAVEGRGTEQSEMGDSQSTATQSHRNAKCAAKRRRIEEETPSPQHSKPSYAEVLKNAQPVQVGLQAEDFKAAKGAHTGKRGSKKAKAKYPEEPVTLKQLMGIGTPHPILDLHGHVIAVLCGQPTDQSYHDALFRLFLKMVKLDTQLSNQNTHRRGSFRAYNMGVIMGMGSKWPVNLDLKGATPLIRSLLGEEGVKRMIGFHNVSFAFWAPRLFAKYKEVMQAVLDQRPELQPPFKEHVFSACTFNFDNVWTRRHRDFFNWPFGWCFITALGRFDYTKGGQLILWDLKLVIDFPHGATIAIPSAVCMHSNIPVRPGDQRRSFTQFSAGPIFRWYENGFQTQKDFEKSDPAKYAAMMASKESAYLDRRESWDPAYNIKDTKPFLPISTMVAHRRHKTKSQQLDASRNKFKRYYEK